MRGIEGEQILMRIFIGERDRWHGRPLADCLIELLRREGFAGATVLRGIQGFGAHSRVHKDSILDLSADLPLVLEVVDEDAKIQAVLPQIDAMMGGGMITLERAHVILYRGHKAAPPTST
jgi:PII-like signaling protein